MRGAPEDVDLLEHAAAGVGALGGAPSRVVEPVELLADAGDRRHHGAAARLRRVRGQDGVQRQAGEKSVEVIVTVQASNLFNGRRERVTDAAAAGVARSQHPHPVMFLGEVRQMEVHRERPGDVLGAI